MVCYLEDTPRHSLFALADPGGATGIHPPTGSNSFIFAYVFTEKHPRRRSVPPQWLSAPSTGNPGSATGLSVSFLQNGFTKNCMNW